MYVYLNGERVSENMPPTTLTICLAVGSIITIGEFYHRSQDKWVKDECELKFNIDSLRKRGIQIRKNWDGFKARRGR